MRTEARFGAVDRGAGHYESFYLKAAAPDGGRAVWIRHTIHKRPGAEPTCAIWFTLFGTGGPRATKASFPAAALSVPEGSYVKVGEAAIGPGEAVGRVETEALAASWKLSFADRHESLRHLPSEWMYRGRLPRTKLLSPHPGALFDGELEIGEERIDLRGWPGMVGHNWGAEHAERWIWIHADLPGGEAGDYLDIAAGRIKLGPLTAPWIANGRIVLGGTAYGLGGLGRSYGTDIDAGSTHCRFTVPGRRINVHGTVTAPAERFVAWLYADPDGGSHNALNCSIADIELKIERPGERHVRFEAKGAAAYEIGMRDTDHPVPVQPYPDGELEPSAPSPEPPGRA